MEGMAALFGVSFSEIRGSGGGDLPLSNKTVERDSGLDFGLSMLRVKWVSLT